MSTKSDNKEKLRLALHELVLAKNITRELLRHLGEQQKTSLLEAFDGIAIMLGGEDIPSETAKIFGETKNQSAFNLGQIVVITNGLYEKSTTDNCFGRVIERKAIRGCWYYSIRLNDNNLIKGDADSLGMISLPTSLENSFL